MRQLLMDTAEGAVTYLETLDARSVAPTGDTLARLADFDEPLPEAPTAPEEVLAILDRSGSPATVASAGGRYFDFVTGGSQRAGRTNRAHMPPRPLLRR